MAPEYGATMGFFGVDEATRRLSARAPGGREEHVRTVRELLQGAGAVGHSAKPGASTISQVVELDLATVSPRVAGPKRPQDRIDLDKLKRAISKSCSSARGRGRLRQNARRPQGSCANPPDGTGRRSDHGPRIIGRGLSVGTERNEAEMITNRPTPGLVAAREAFDPIDADIRHGQVLIAAITSCTNTSNPSVMLAAGLLAKKADARGLRQAGLVKTSLAPGSRVVTDYLEKTGLQTYARSTRLPNRRLRLHDVHRQQRAARTRPSKRPSRRTTSSPLPCSRATATSRRASIRASRRTFSCRRRSSSPSPSPAAWTST